MEYPPDTSFCSDLGLSGRLDADNRYLVPTKAMYFAPRIGLAWDVFGTGKTSVRGGFGIFYSRERVSPGLGVGQNPPLSGSGSVTRTLDSNPSSPARRGAAYGTPGNAFEQKAANSHNYQWNMSFQQELFKNTVLEVAYVGNQGKDLVGQTNLNEIPLEDRRTSPSYGTGPARPTVSTTAARRRRHGQRPQRQHRALDPRPRVDLPRSAGRAHQPVRPGLGRSRSPTPTSKVLANTGIANADGPGLSANNAYTDSRIPTSIVRAAATTARTCSAAASCSACRSSRTRARS